MDCKIFLFDFVLLSTFEIPSMQGVKKVTVTKEFVTGKGDLVIETEAPESKNEESSETTSL